MSWIDFVQAMNLGFDRLMHNVRVLYTHPKKTFFKVHFPVTPDPCHESIRTNIREVANYTISYEPRPQMLISNHL